MIAVTGNRTVIVFDIHGGGYDDAYKQGVAHVDPCYGVAVWDEHIQTFVSINTDTLT